jgi:hypothetical protein
VIPLYIRSQRKSKSEGPEDLKFLFWESECGKAAFFIDQDALLNED